MVAGLLARRLLWLPAVGAGLAATATRYYFTNPQRVIADLPADLAASAEHVYLPARDGPRLHAIWIPAAGVPAARPPERTIVHLHGYNSSAGVLLSRVPPFQWGRVRLPYNGAQPLVAWSLVRAALARGYNFLLTDIRGHGESGGPWDTTGRLAVTDAMRWAQWLRAEHGQLWAGLWGHSFGASVGLALAAMGSGGGFDAMVLDSPAVTAEGIYSGIVRKPVYWIIQPVLHQLSNKNLLQQLEATRVWMPILLIHGTEDRHVPAWQSQGVHDLIHDPQQPERVQLWLAPGADHLAALEVAEDAYIARTLSWFDKWFGNG